MTAIEVALLLIGVVFIIGSFFIIEKLSPTELSRVSELSEDELRIVMDRELATAGAKISDVVDQTVDLSIDQIQRRMEKDTNEKIMAISEYSDLAMEQLKKFNNEVTFLYSMLGDKHTELNESIAQLNEMMNACQTVQAQMASTLQQMQMHQPQQQAQKRPVSQQPIQQRQVTQAQQQPVQQRQMTQAQQQSVQQQPLQRQYPEQAPIPEKPERTVEEPEWPSQQETVEAQQEAAIAESAAEDHSMDVREEILRRYRSGEDMKDIARDLSLGYGEVKLIVELYKGDGNL